MYVKPHFIFLVKHCHFRSVWYIALGGVTWVKKARDYFEWSVKGDPSTASQRPEEEKRWLPTSWYNKDNEGDISAADGSQPAWCQWGDIWENCSFSEKMQRELQVYATAVKVSHVETLRKRKYIAHNFVIPVQSVWKARAERHQSFKFSEAKQNLNYVGRSEGGAFP